MYSDELVYNDNNKAYVYDASYDSGFLDHHVQSVYQGSSDIVTKDLITAYKENNSYTTEDNILTHRIGMIMQ